MKHLLCIITILSITTFCLAQIPQFEWAKDINGGNTEAYDLTTDSNGNIYCIGRLQGTADFDMGPGVFELTSNVPNALYVTKTDSLGNFIWAGKIGGSLTGIYHVFGNSIEVDQQGSVFITGTFYGWNVDFDMGPQSHSLNAFNSNLFICKYNTDGEYQWAYNLQASGTHMGRSLTLDDNSNVYYTGNYKGTIDFDPGPNTFNLVSPGNQSAFISIMSSTGNFVNATAIDAKNSVGSSIKRNEQGEIFLLGYFTDTLNYDLGSGTSSLVSNGDYDIFIMKFNSALNLLWIRLIGGPGDQLSKSMEFDEDGNIYIGGSFSDTINVVPGVSNYLLPSLGVVDAFTMKLDSSGNFIWGNGFKLSDENESVSDRLYKICVGEDKNIYYAGSFKGIGDFDSGPDTLNLSSNGSNDMFIMKNDSNGNLLWARSLGSANQDNIYDLYIKPNGNLLLAGSFRGTYDFAFIPKTAILSSSEADAFILELSETDKPLAYYTLDKRFIHLGEDVTFNNGSLNNPTNYLWDMGDGSISISENLVYTFSEPGYYTVSLTASDSINSNTYSIEDCIVVLDEYPEFSWVNTYGSTDIDYANSLTEDVDGNIYFTGNFANTVDFDPGIGTTSLTSVSSKDIFISKNHGDGSLSWAFSLQGSTSLDYGSVNSLKTDTLKNLYVTGSFTGNLDFDPGPGTDYHSSENTANNIFVAKYDSLGNHIWAITLGGSGQDYAYDINMDDIGNIYLIGSFEDTVDFNPGPAIVNLISYSNPNTFILKLSNNGIFRWVKKFTGSSTGFSIALGNSGEIVVTGEFSGTGNFYTGTSYQYLFSSGLKDIFMIKLDTAGNFGWAKSMGGNHNDTGRSIEISESGKIVIGGSVRSYNADFDPGSGTYFIQSNGMDDAFVATYTLTGELIWVRHMGGSSGDITYSIALSDDGLIYASGYFISQADFVSGNGVYNLESNPLNSFNSFIVELDSLGIVQWVGSLDHSKAHSIFSGSDGNVSVAGRFSSSCDFDLGDGVMEVTSAGNYDIFLLKIKHTDTFKAIFNSLNTSITLADSAQFNDLSCGNPNSWFWDFGDGNTSTLQNPVHQYLSGGYYTVSLVISDGVHTDTLIREDYIYIESELSLGVDIEHVSCYGYSDGSINIDFQAGTPPYTVVWNQGGTTGYIDSLSSGTYSVSVVDMYNMTFTDTLFVSQPLPLEINSNITDSLCNGAIELIIIGGTSPYNFQWSNGASLQNISGIEAGNYNVTVSDNNNCILSDSFEIVFSALPLTILYEKTNVSCNSLMDGSIEIDYTSGLQDSVIVNWSNGSQLFSLSNLSAGFYQVTVTQVNYGCYDTQVIEVTEPNVLFTLPTIVNDSCLTNPGSITLHTEGGTLPYEYIWTTGDTLSTLINLVGGIYSVTITDSNICQFIDSYTILQPTAPFTVDLTSTNVSCHGLSDGAIDATISGGLPDTVSIIWSNGSTTEDLYVVPAGVYEITVTQNTYQCIDTQTVEVLEPDTMSIFLIPLNIDCFGNNSGFIYTTISGGTAPYSYMWNTGFTSNNLTYLPAGTYSLTVIDDHNCSNTKQINLTEPPLLTATIIVTDVIGIGNSNGAIQILPSGGNSPYLYSWNTGASLPSLSNIIAGIYSLTITDANQCAWDSAFTVNELVGMENIISFSGISIFPNPANNNLYINLCKKLENEKMELINSIGQKVLEKVIGNELNIELDIRHLPSGEYFIRVIEEGKQVFVEKVVKE